MFGFKGRGSGEVRVDVAQPADAPELVAQVADVDRQLLALALIPRPYWSPTTRERADRLLDLRNAIRPARPLSVPVIPGRSS